MFARFARSAMQRGGRTLMGGAAVAAGAGAFAGYTDCVSIDLDAGTAKSLMKALESATVAKGPRYNEVLPSPASPKFKLAVVEFNVPGAKNGGSDKGPNGHRIDSIPIANGVIKAGGSCDILKYFDTKHAEFAKKIQGYDALIVRINPGQLSQGTLPGTQERFDALMYKLLGPCSHASLAPRCSGGAARSWGALRSPPVRAPSPATPTA